MAKRPQRICGRIVTAKSRTTVLGVAALGLAAVVYGLCRPGLHPLEFWPDNTLWQFCGVVAGYAVCCAMVFAIPALRRRHRAIFATLAIWLMIGGAGMGGFATACALLLSALALGDLITRSASRCSAVDAWAHALVCTVIGLCLWSLTTWTLAHFPVNVAALYAVLWSIPVLANRRGLAFYGRVLRDWLFDPAEFRPGVAEVFTGCAAFGFLVIQLAVSMWPAVGCDTLNIHLKIMGAMDWHRAYDFDPRLNVMGLVPYFSNWLLAPCYLLGGESAAKLSNGLLFVLTAGGCWIVMRRMSSPTWASLAVAILASTPTCLATIESLFTENAMALSVVALWTAMVCLNRVESWRWHLGLAILLGYPVLLKPYGALLAAGEGVVLAMWILRRDGSRGLLRHAAFMTPVAAAVAAPPYLFAWISCGNPLFPFYNAIFRSPFYAPENLVDRRWIGRFGWDVLYRMTFESNLFCEMAPGGLGLHLLILVPCALLAFLAIRHRVVWSGLVPLVAYGGAMLYLIQYARYLVPVFPLAVVLGLAAIETAARRGVWLRRTAFLTLIALCGVNLVLLPTGAWVLRGLPLETAFTAKARDEFVRAMSPYRRAVSCINATSEGDCRAAFLDAPFTAELHGTALLGCWSNPTFSGEVRRVASVKDVYTLIDKWRLTHCVWGTEFPAPQRLLFEQALAPIAAGRQKIAFVTVIQIDAVALNQIRSNAGLLSPHADGTAQLAPNRK
jgi:hypothetical protein